MRTWEEIQGLLESVKTLSDERAAARATAKADAMAMAEAIAKSQASNETASNAQSAVANAVQAVNDALAEIVNQEESADDSGEPVRPKTPAPPVMPSAAMAPGSRRR